MTASRPSNPASSIGARGLVAVAWLALLVGVVVSLTPDSGELLTWYPYGERWPFAETEVRIDCDRNRVTVTLSSGEVLGINDTAVAFGLPPADPALHRRAKTPKGRETLRRIVIDAQERLCRRTGKVLVAEDFGERWPFVADRVYLDCTSSRVMVRIPERGLYAVNRAAVGYGIRPVDEESLRRDPSAGGRMRYDWLVQQGLEWCEQVEGTGVVRTDNSGSGSR